MHRLLYVIVLAIMAVAFAPTASAATSLASLKGTWVGKDVGAEIRVTMRLSGGANGSTVKLRGAINCSGRETYTGRTATAFKFQERILRSASDNCVGLGWVTLTPQPDGTLAYHWTDRAGNHARAMLQRLMR